MSETPSFSSVQALLDQADSGQIVNMNALAGGANNRVFAVKTTHRSVLLKVYFRHPDDARDRLHHEWSFAKFAWDYGVRSLPMPLACHQKNGLALFEFVPGRKLKPNEPNRDHIQQAIDFFHKLWEARQSQDCSKLPQASEACFSVAAHLQTIANRVQRLQTINPESSKLHQDAYDFVVNDLGIIAESILQQIQEIATTANVVVDEEIELSQRCISPSDFGYHNAILAETDHQLRFIDFEYAGWDDPAKLICDFFCQPAIPAPLKYFNTFAEQVASTVPDSTQLIHRANWLLPAYQIKWLCIRLNSFLPVGQSRRAFALSPDHQRQMQEEQLQQAKAALATLEIPKSAIGNRG